MHGNLNKNLFSCVFSSNYDFIFLSETNLAYKSLPTIKNYVLFSDLKDQNCSFGGIAWYIHEKLAKHVFDIVYNVCFISFRIVLAPKYVFIGVYIQPEGARYFCQNMFSSLTKFIVVTIAKGYIPYVGGDLNSRVGNINLLVPDNTWLYDKNVHPVINTHGRTFVKDMCITTGI